MAGAALTGHGDLVGIQSLAPDDLRASSRPVLDWLAATGCSRVAVHFDVDTVDSNEIGLGLVPGGLTSSQVRRLVADVDQAAEVVGLTTAEFIPRQDMHLKRPASTSVPKTDRQVDHLSRRVAGRPSQR
ncbi:hypothetical protein [Streptomyces yatensis]|nr:hypothetical protein [Streptomyces yatensis]